MGKLADRFEKVLEDQPIYDDDPNVIDHIHRHTNPCAINRTFFVLVQIIRKLEEEIEFLKGPNLVDDP